MHVPQAFSTCSFTVGGGEDLGMRLLLREVGKGSVYGTQYTTQLPHTRPTMHCIPLVRLPVCWKANAFLRSRLQLRPTFVVDLNFAAHANNMHVL